MSSLSIHNITKRFGDTEVLSDINIEIGSGEFLVLVGPSGCGKSTLLNMIAGLLEISSGEIRLADERIENKEPKDRNIAMVFQSYALYPSMTVGKNMAFPLRMSGVPKAEQDRKVAEVAELLQIDHLLNRKPAALSGGQRQRVAMGRALVRDPQLFLFDEPLSNLDAKLRVDMRSEIKRLHKRLGTTIVYVTHDQVEAMTMATRIAVMEGGVVQQFGTPADIYDHPANTFVATFMGSPAMNLLDATVDQDGASLRIGDTITLPAPVGASVPAPGTAVKLGLRPEWFSVGEDSGPDLVGIPARIDITEPTGPDIYAELLIAGQHVMARLPAGTPLQSDTDTQFHVDMSKALLFDATSGAALTAA